MRVMVGLFAAVCLVSAQSSETATITVRGTRATISVNSPRPVDSMAAKLSEHYGIVINSEDPTYLFAGDVRDVTAKVVRGPRPSKAPVLIPRGGKLEASFAVDHEGRPMRVADMLHAIADAANASFPFAFTVDDDGDAFGFVPTRTRSKEGTLVDAPPLLDRLVTIPPGVRPIYESARLMAEALSAQAGVHVTCCQSVIAGVPWGMKSISFAADKEPARRVLRRLIRAEYARAYWMVRCDPGGGCHIEVKQIQPRMRMLVNR